MHPFPNPLFGSLRMQHPWNLDTFYSRRHGNKGEKASVRKVAGGRVSWKELESRWQQTRTPACDLLQSHCSFFCLLVQEGGLAVGGERHTWSRTHEGFSVQPQGHSSWARISHPQWVFFHMMSLPFSEMTGGSQWLQKSASTLHHVSGITC